MTKNIRALCESAFCGKATLTTKKAVKEATFTIDETAAYWLIRERIEARFGKGSEWYSGDMSDYLLDNFFTDGSDLSLSKLDEFLYNTNIVEQDDASYNDLIAFYNENGGESIPFPPYEGDIILGVFECRGSDIIIIGQQ